MTHHNHETVTRTRAFFDERAAKWDMMISAQHPARLRRIIGTLAVAPNARVLDVGCGTGVLFPIVAAMLDARGMYVAADVSFEMMRQTRKRAAVPQTDRTLPALLLIQADVTQPPLQEVLFDWVLCNSCFPHFYDQQGAINTMAALLKPGGKLVVCHTESRDAINELHRTVGGAVGGHELPANPAMSVMIGKAGLTLETLEDSPDAYLLVARK